ncbi:hypothetical protein [Streptomyces sp. NPDC047070]|uniref:hypothetical protein n=1 Tax=Streptomyces sp. NPDC047070 TaxID=3154923 RepID=UPI00345664BE
MTIHRRYELAATAGALLLAALAAACVYHGLSALALAPGLGAAISAEAAVRERRRHRRVLAEHEWARQEALGRNPAPLDPCCLLGQASHGAAHRGCTDRRTSQSGERDSA